MPKKRTIFRYIVPFIIIIISILFVIVMKNTKPAPVQKEAQKQAWSVESMRIEKNSHTPALQLYGQIITEHDIQLTASIEANLKNTRLNCV